MTSGTTRPPDGFRPETTDGLLTTLTTARRARRRPPALRALVAVTAAAAAVALSGCANPEYRFISSDKRDVVVRVPWSWTKIDKDAVEKLGQTGDQQDESTEDPGSWLVFYDGADKPAAAHLIAKTVPAPVVVLQSGDVPDSARDTLTTDMLRDLVFPVSESSRAQQKVTAQATGQKAPDIRMLTDEPVSTKTSDGVHLIFSIDGEMFDQITVTDPKRARFHLLLVHCSKSCFEASRKQIDEITDSFTIKKP